MISLLLFDVVMPTVFVAWVVLLVTLEVTAVRRGRRYVERWAAAMSYQTQSVKLRRLPTAAWGIWYNAASNRIFEVAVTEASGESRTAFVKVSGGLFGLVPDDIEWRWVPQAAS